MSKKLSVIIVCYNSVRLLPDCLDSIREFNDIGDALEIILVDNNSNDRNELDQLTGNYVDLNIQLIDNPVNGGYGQGNNIGVNASSSPFFVVINPDVRLVEPLFGKLLGLMNEKPDTGLIGVNFKDLSSPLYLKPEYFSLINLLFVNQILKAGIYSINEVYLQGSFLFFRKEAFLRAGQFDEKIFLYYEEADIANRISDAGFKIKWERNIKVLHLAHDRPYNPKLLKVQVDSLEYYIDKNKYDKRKIFKILRTYYQLKRFVARMMKNEVKIDYFGGWIALINQKLSEKHSR